MPAQLSRYVRHAPFFDVNIEKKGANAILERRFYATKKSANNSQKQLGMLVPS
jgi:hypothetical protein